MFNQQLSRFEDLLAKKPRHEWRGPIEVDCDPDLDGVVAKGRLFWLLLSVITWFCLFDGGWFVPWDHNCRVYAGVVIWLLSSLSFLLWCCGCQVIHRDSRRVAHCHRTVSESLTAFRGGISRGVFVRWSKVHKWLKIVWIFCLFRVGEAQHPGPSCEWSLGTFNSSGIAHRADVISALPGDFWGVAETHLSPISAKQFVRGLQCSKSHYKYLVQGHPCPLRTRSSHAGDFTGVAALSQWPCRALPHSFPEGLFETSRIQVVGACIHQMWITIGTIYGVPKSSQHKHPRFQTDVLLEALVDRVGAQTAGPRVVMGDFNWEPHELSQVRRLQDMGFVELQDLAAAWWDAPIKPTGRGSTRIDAVYVSRELACLLKKVVVDHTQWPDHAMVYGLFAAPSPVLETFHWKSPKQCQWPEQWTPDVSPVFTQGASVAYADFWNRLEQQASAHDVAQGKPRWSPRWQDGVKPLQRFALRHHRVQFVRVVMVKSLLSSLARLFDLPSNSSKSAGFRPMCTFAEKPRLLHVVNWLSCGPAFVIQRVSQVDFVCGLHLFTMLNHLSHVSCLLCHRRLSMPVSFSPWFRMRFVVLRRTFWVSVCMMQRNVGNMISTMCLKIVNGSNLKKSHFWWIRLLVRLWKLTMICFLSPLTPQEIFSSTEPIMHKGEALQVIHAEPGVLWVEQISQVEVGQDIRQTTIRSSLPDIFQAFHDEWSPRWNRLQAVLPSQWDQITSFAARVLRPVEWNFEPWEHQSFSYLHSS